MANSRVDGSPTLTMDPQKQQFTKVCKSYYQRQFKVSLSTSLALLCTTSPINVSCIKEMSNTKDFYGLIKLVLF